MISRKFSLPAIFVAGALALSGCAAPADPASTETSDSGTTVTMRVWDETVAEAYEASFEAFTKKNPNITVELNVVPWAEYWKKLRTDVAGSSADDLFWVNNAYFAPYADSGNLVDVTELLGADAQKAWEPSVVEQYTREDQLWGVPQFYDAGIAVYYNKAILEEAGVDPAELAELSWVPGGGEGDSYLPMAKKLTRDANGVAGDTEGFDGANLARYGTNLSYDVQGVLLPFIGSNGGTFQDGEDFSFAGEKSAQAVEYIVKAVNEAHVAPSAADTNLTDDFNRDAFIQGNMAMFQSGLYNLKNVADGAEFEWGVAPIPAGPEGRVAVTNGIAVAGNAHSTKKDAVKKVMQWLGSAEGNAPLGAAGSAVPAVVEAQSTYFDFWKKEGVDVQPFFDVISETTPLPPLSGANYSAGYAAFHPILQEVFKGSVPVGEGLKRAQDAGNVAIRK